MRCLTGPPVDLSDNLRFDRQFGTHQSMRDIGINRIMTTNPATVTPNDPLSAATQLLQSGDIHHLPVAEAGILQGIVSSSDLLKFHLVNGGADRFANVPVRQIMQADPYVIKSGASLRDAAMQLSDGGFHALPVVEPDLTLVGIVTTGDLVAHLLRQIPTGDGSLQPAAEMKYAGGLGDSEITTVLHTAEQSVEHGNDPDKLARLVLYFRNQNRLLQHACQAAELYMRSGHGEREHSVLIKRLADLRNSDSDNAL